jgi:hypothetical protein
MMAQTGYKLLLLGAAIERVVAAEHCDEATREAHLNLARKLEASGSLAMMAGNDNDLLGTVATSDLDSLSLPERSR